MSRWVRGTSATLVVPALVLGGLLAGTTAAAGGPPPRDDVDLGGAAVEGSTDPADPTTVEAGLWSDVLGAGSTGQGVHHFRYQRTMQDSTVLVGVVGTSAAESSDNLDLEVTTPDGTSCGTDIASLRYPVGFASIGAAVAVGPDEPGERDSACLVAEELYVSVGRGTSNETSDLPFALRIAEEAPVISRADELTPPPESPSVDLPGTGAASDVEGGTAFDDAPDLAAGTTYATTVAEGEERLFRVPLTWGERLAVRVDVPAIDEAMLEEIGYGGPAVDLTLVDPRRGTFSGDLEDVVASGTWGEEPLTLSEGTVPVRYLNRFEGVPAGYPGDYWVSLAVEPAGDRDPLDVPVEITVEVAGEPDGGPRFPETVAGPGGTRGPEGYSPDTPYLVAPGTFASDVSGNPPLPGEEDGGSDGRRVAGLVVGGLSLVSVLGGAALLLRRRRTA